MATIVLFLTVGVLACFSLSRTQGLWIYPLDDTYIHMAMAKNFARHEVWGITRDGFTYSSSSPLWTLLLAVVYAVAGVNTISPFIMSLVSACLVLVVAYWILRASRMSSRLILFVLLGVLFLTPLPALVFGGMEHALQTAFTLTATFLAARILTSAESVGGPKCYLWLMVMAPLLTSVRFEGMFLVAVIGLGFFLRSQVRRGLGFGLLGLLPVVACGVVSRLHGWPWLPTSVLLKSSLSRATAPEPFLAGVWQGLLSNLWGGRHLAALIVLAILLEVIAQKEEGWTWKRERIMTGVFVGTGILHLCFAQVGWFYRYEAYLVALGILVVASRFNTLSLVLGKSPAHGSRTQDPPFADAAPFLVVISLVFCVSRGTAALMNIPRASANIFEQQYQTARFIRRYYQHSAVALNDIGMVNFLADIHCLDMWGLGSLPITHLQLGGRYYQQTLARLVADRGVRVAIAYEAGFGGMGGLPPEWTKVGQWHIGNNVVAEYDTVSIYAPGSSEVKSLAMHLAEFSKELPPGVVQSGLYTQAVHSSR